MNKRELAKAVDDLSSPSRRKRQEAAHAIAEHMVKKPESILDFTDDIFDALERPEAQTRWELLNSLTQVVEGNARALSAAVDFSEPSLFDEGSSTVRLAAFRFISAMGAQTKTLSKKVWPMLDESLQVYHGDPQYREMLIAMVDFVSAPIDPDIKKAVVARIKFDAKNSTFPLVKRLSNDVLKAARGQKVKKATKAKATAEKPAAKKAAAKKAVAKKATTTKASTKKASTKKASTVKATAKKTAAKKEAAKKTAAKKTTTQKTAAKKSVAKKPMVKKATAKKASASAKTGAKKAAGTKATAKKSTANKAVTKKATAKKATAKKPAASKTAAGKASAKKVATKKINKKAATPRKKVATKTSLASKTLKKVLGKKVGRKRK